MDDWFSKLRQRRAYRAIAVYVVTAFAVWQAADIAIPALSLPEAWMRYIVGGALAGLPIVGILSWLPDLRTAASPARPRKGAHRSSAQVGAVILSVAVVILIIGAAYRLLPRANADTAVSYELGIERYFAGDLYGAATLLAEVAAAPDAPVDRRQEAARYLVRSNSELGDTASARRAMRQLLALEPPLALMLPSVEAEPVMKLYYAARKDKLAASPRSTQDDTVGFVEVLDFVVLGESPRGTAAAEWQPVGNAVKEIVLSDLVQHAAGAVRFVDRSTAALSRQYDIYRYLNSRESEGVVKPTHILIGSVAARGDQVLVSSWLIDARIGGLLGAAQALGSVNNVFELATRLAADVRRTLLDSP